MKSMNSWFHIVSIYRHNITRTILYYGLTLLYVCVHYVRWWNPRIDPVGSNGVFCKKKQPPKAILLHFLSPYEITLALLHDCMFVYVRLKSQVVVNYGQKISVNFNICFLVKVKRYLKCYNKSYFVKIFEPYYLSKINIMRYQKTSIKM